MFGFFLGLVLKMGVGGITGPQSCPEFQVAPLFQSAIHAALLRESAEAPRRRAARPVGWVKIQANPAAPLAGLATPPDDPATQVDDPVSE